MRNTKPRFKMRQRQAKVRRRRKGVEITAGLTSGPAFFFRRRSIDLFKR